MSDHVTFIDNDITSANRVTATWLNGVNNAAYRANTGITGAVGKRTALEKFADFVFADDFSGGTQICYSTRAAALAGNDATTAITAALASGKPVRLKAGFYSHTGGFLMNYGGTGSTVLLGEGNQAEQTGTHGTTLVKRSGTAITLSVSNIDVLIKGISFDGNDLNGSQLVLNGCKYSTFEDLSFFKQGTTSVCMRTVAGNATYVNLCEFNRLQFSAAGALGYILLDANMLYSVFNDIIMAGLTTNTRWGMEVGAVGATLGYLTFNKINADSGIYFHDSVTQTDLRDLFFEAIVGTECVKVGSGGVQGFHIYNLWNNPGGLLPTQPTLHFISANGITLKHIYDFDSNATAGPRTGIRLNTCSNVIIQDARRNTSVASYFVECVTGASDNVTIINQMPWVTNNSTNLLWCSNLTIIGGNTPTAFVAGNTDCTVISQNASIDTTNTAAFVDLSGRSTAQTYTGTLTGGTTAPTYTVQCARLGNVVTLSLPEMTVTSNAVTKTVTGMPARYRPTSTRLSVARVSDNGGAYVFGLVSVASTGTIEYFITAASGAWTAAGAATIGAHQIIYTLA